MVTSFDNLGTTQLTVESLKESWKQLKEFKQGKLYSKQERKDRIMHEIIKNKISKMCLRNTFEQGKMSCQVYKELISYIDEEIAFLKEGLKKM